MNPVCLSHKSILVTGSSGFIGKNLIVKLQELLNVRVITFVRGDDEALLPKLVADADAIVHLAGENRPVDVGAFFQVNSLLTSVICQVVKQEIQSTGRLIPLILASSTQVEYDNPYGRSKMAAERFVQALAQETGAPCAIFRLPGVFGKWCKPDYNSVVATFCHNIARSLKIQINDPSAKLRLVYVDDVVSSMLAFLEAPTQGVVQFKVDPEYTITLAELADQIHAFGSCRTNLMTERVGTGFVRALYATYVSYLPSERFSYRLNKNSDPRGVFVEMLKTRDSGQFSYFTAHPGITRGGHYHHTKTEKFLVVKGEAVFRFRHLLSNELVELHIRGDDPQVVDTIPGWSHDITNIGSEELVVMLWASENFDKKNPDTYASKV